MKKYTRYTTPRSETVKRSIKKETIETATAEVLSSILNKMKKDFVDTSKIEPSLKGHLKSELSRITAEIPKIKNELMSSVKSLSKLSNGDTITIVMEEINGMQEVLNNMERRKKSLESQLHSLNSSVKATLINGLSITRNDLLNDSELFKRALSLYIKDIQLFEDKIVYNLKELQ